MDEKQNAAGIKDIARALKVSIATVDRALHGRHGVNEITKARVMQMAKQLGYQPNLAAQALKLNRGLSIAAILPKHISHFFGPLRAGIQDAAAATVGTRVSLDFYEYPRLGIGEAKAFETALQKRYDGIIFVPGDAQKLEWIIRKLSLSGTAIMCVGSDAPNTERVGSVAANAYVSGSIAAELLSHKVARKADAAIFTGGLSTRDHAEKLRGFAATLALQAPHLTLLPVLENHDQPEEAYKQAFTLMESKRRPEDLYLSTANSIPVLRALQELQLLGKVQVITTDLFRELVPLIESSKVLATLYQRPYTPGKLAFENLIAHVLQDGKTQNVVRLAPHIVLRANLSLFASQVSKSDDEIEAEPVRA